jgi:hypothetical protein
VEDDSKLSIDPEADERLVRATAWVEASSKANGNRAHLRGTDGPSRMSLVTGFADHVDPEGVNSMSRKTSSSMLMCCVICWA